MKVVNLNSETVKQKEPEKLSLASVKSRCKGIEGIGTITKLASLVPCSTPVIYFAIERPTRYSRVYSRILEILK